MDWKAASAELSRKLDPAHVRPAKSFGPKGDYIEGWHAMAEANRIFGFEGWSYTVPECTCVYQGARDIGKDKKPGFGVTYTAKVAVVVDGVVREDFGAGHGYDVDCGLAHESAIKEAITDALKRALRSFGNPFGLALYDKTRENVGIDAPPFDAEGCLQRLLNGTAKRKTKQDLEDFWKAEAEARIALKTHDANRYETFRKAFKEAGEAALHDPARQAAPVDGEVPF
jgi:DNA repair and recombination protein RAD52